MNLFVQKVYNKLIDRAFFSQKISYAQSGEDIILNLIFTWVLKIERPNFLDIGAHHPHALSNTYFFYKKGSRGVNVEPDPSLIEHIRKMRPKDTNIHSGVGFKNEPELADFYVMSAKELNTFSKSEAYRVQDMGQFKINEVIKVELININTILSEYFTSNNLDLLSIDVEGLDFEILSSLDFSKFQPKVICAETNIYNGPSILSKRTETIDLVLSKGYKVYADTCINTIFIRSDLV